MDFKTKKAFGEIKSGALKRVVDSPAFQAWFGQSRITNQQGEPLVCYHGTGVNFAEFKASQHGEYGQGIYLSFRPESAHLWATLSGARNESVQIMPLFVRMEKPFIVSKLDLHEMALEEDGEGEPIGMNEVHRRLKEQGYDGIIGTGLVESDKQIIVFFAQQLKSAISNSGEFDPQSADIIK